MMGKNTSCIIIINRVADAIQQRSGTAGKYAQPVLTCWETQQGQAGPSLQIRVPEFL